MSYRPITDVWMLTRAKLKDGRKFYGAYPGGFPERARALLGVSINDPVLHACAGLMKFYPYQGALGPNDRTLDLDPGTEPDYCQDVRDPWPHGCRSVLADPPYSEADAEHYFPGSSCYPSPNMIVQRAMEILPVGGRVGILHFVMPGKPRVPHKLIATVGVTVGYNNRIRVYTVFEKRAMTE